MKCKVEGVFMESGTRKNSKTGDEVPYIVIYSDKEAVQINGCDGSQLELYTPVTIPVSVSSGSYGLYVRAINE